MGPLHKKDKAEGAGQVSVSGWFPAWGGTVASLGDERARTERTRVWDPLSRRKSGPEAKLSHTSLWRWLQDAGEKVEKKRLGGWYRGFVLSSGALVADSTEVKVRGVSVPLHLIFQTDWGQETSASSVEPFGGDKPQQIAALEERFLQLLRE